MIPATPKPDLITAIATPPGRGGIGVIRVSGQGAADLALALTGRRLKPRHATHVAFLDAAGQPLDEGLALFFPAPHSFTGEDVVELHGHGGQAVLQALLSRCLELGARLAQAGEFTQRAYLNGKLDLAQAEAVADLIDASSQEAARCALRSLSGEFSRHIQALQNILTETRIRVEAGIDFPEEDDVVQVQTARVGSDLARSLAALDEVLAAARQGALLREGVSVVLIGQPNVGKSSLMNALAGDEVAIVSEVPGTTRDAIRQEVQIEGIGLHLIDTAGLRATEDPVEKIGIARAWTAIDQAAIALLLLDAQHGLGVAEQDILQRLPVGIARLNVHNKIDLAGEAPRVAETEKAVEVWVSAKTGEGVPLLRRELLRLAGWQPAGEGGFMARARHLAALNRARSHLLKATDLGKQLELQAEELHLAQQALSEITGEFSADELLGEIFSSFCVGK